MRILIVSDFFVKYGAQQARALVNIGHDVAMLVRSHSAEFGGSAEERDEVLDALGATTQPRILGVTGPPGAGKSTTVGALVSAYRERNMRVAVLAVDPSSPYSGGALLGDRIRMAAHINDPDVLIRSVATRGHLGGLAAAVPAAISEAESRRS